MALLFISELYDYLTPKVTEELFVDTTRSHKLRINIDITLPKVACSCEFTVRKFMSYTLKCLLRLDYI